MKSKVKLRFRDPARRVGTLSREASKAKSKYKNGDDTFSHDRVTDDVLNAHTSFLIMENLLTLGVDNIGDERLADKSDAFDYEERGRFFYGSLRMFF
jgi:outer membrane receptor for ferrienterochelin and colicin